MSEREVYDMLRMHYEVCYDGCKCGRCSEVHKAIAESKECPDVVAAARKVMEIHAEILGNEAPTAYSATACGTLWGVRKMLEATFGFRLTDEGWEWTADA